MANNTNDTPWYESFFSWFGSTAKDIYSQEIQSKTAKYEADAIRDAYQAQNNNQTLSFFGKELSKETILWIFGGTVASILLLSLIRRR